MTRFKYCSANTQGSSRVTARATSPLGQRRTVDLSLRTMLVVCSITGAGLLVTTVSSAEPVLPECDLASADSDLAPAPTASPTNAGTTAATSNT